MEITGPTERKMTINALNSGARVWLADLEDANTPHWSNVVAGQVNLSEAVRRTISHRTDDGKDYALREDRPLPTIVMRPRGWHLPERHVTCDGKPVAGALVDFGLYFFHNAAELLARGSGPYFYLPKLESHLEARLWNDVFAFAEERLGLPEAVVRATVLIETIPAAFEMDEMLFELQERASGLNAGRWDYLFSLIKELHAVRPGLRAARPQLGHDDRAVHERVRRAAGAHLPPPRRLRDGRHGRVHPEPARPRAERGGDRQGARGQGRARRPPASTAPGSRTPTWCRSARRSSTACSGTGRTSSTVLREDVDVTAEQLLDVPSAGGQADGGRAARQRRGRAALPGVVAARHRRGGDQQPDGGRRHRRDLAVAGVAVAHLRRDARRRHDGHRRAGVADARRTRSAGSASELGADAWAASRFDDAARILAELLLAPELADFLTIPAYDAID